MSFTNGLPAFDISLTQVIFFLAFEFYYIIVYAYLYFFLIPL